MQLPHPGNGRADLGRPPRASNAEQRPGFDMAGAKRWGGLAHPGFYCAGSAVCVPQAEDHAQRKRRLRESTCAVMSAIHEHTGEDKHVRNRSGYRHHYAFGRRRRYAHGRGGRDAQSAQPRRAGYGRTLCPRAGSGQDHRPAYRYGGRTLPNLRPRRRHRPDGADARHALCGRAGPGRQSPVYVAGWKRGTALCRRHLCFRAFRRHWVRHGHWLRPYHALLARKKRARSGAGGGVVHNFRLCGHASDGKEDAAYACFRGRQSGHF